MTATARRLLAELESTLEQLPEDEQEARAASYLQDARKRGENGTRERERYSFFKVLENTNLPGSKDASVTYEDEILDRQCVLPFSRQAHGRSRKDAGSED